MLRYVRMRLACCGVGLGVTRVHTYLLRRVAFGALTIFWVSIIIFVVMLISWLVGLPVGIISALRPNSLLDNGARVMSILFLAIPGFWLGMLIVLRLLSWFNYKTPLTVVHIWQDPLPPCAARSAAHGRDFLLHYFPVTDRDDPHPA